MLQRPGLLQSAGLGRCSGRLAFKERNTDAQRAELNLPLQSQDEYIKLHNQIISGKAPQRYAVAVSTPSGEQGSLARSHLSAVIA